MRYRPIEDRFLEKYRVNRKTGCWVWTATTVRGYGMLGGDPRSLRYRSHIYAHRFAYEHFVGDIPEDKIVAHKCDNPRCVNPDHLFLTDTAGNMADMEKKGRARILDSAQVKEMCRSIWSGHSQASIAESLGVSRSTVQRAFKKAAGGDYGPKAAIAVATRYTKLTDEDRSKIIGLLIGGETVSAVARRFGVDRKHIRTIRDSASKAAT